MSSSISKTMIGDMLPIVEFTADEAKSKYGVTKQSITKLSEERKSYDYLTFVNQITSEPTDDKIVKFTDEMYKKVDGNIQLIQTIRELNVRTDSLFKETDNYKDFFNRVDLFREMKVMDQEAFYELKLGMRYKGVPAHVIYILKNAINICGTEYPNLLLWSCFNELKPYADKYYMIDGKPCNLKDIIDFVLKKNVQLLSKRKWHTDEEYYIYSEDKIAIIPSYISDSINGNVGYCKDLGLYCFSKDGNLQVVRTMAGKIGITRNDFDLRKVI